jgi:hypothetical protein
MILIDVLPVKSYLDLQAQLLLETANRCRIVTMTLNTKGPNRKELLRSHETLLRMMPTLNCYGASGVDQ